MSTISKTPTECDCDTDSEGCLRRMFVDVVQKRRIDAGQDPASRPVFLKQHGVARGYFEPLADLAEKYRLGVLAVPRVPAWVRFSSDTLPSQPDLETTVGVAIKLFGVVGPKLLGEGDTHDFVLQNHHVFFVDTAKDMCEFTRAGVLDGDYQPYLDAHPRTAAILSAMRKQVPSVLTTAYWGILPSSFGQERFVKYRLEPQALPGGDTSVDLNDPQYLRADMKRRLLDGEARFRFQLQFQSDPDTMPIDQATVVWDEVASPWVDVGVLVLARQDIDARGQAAYGENLSFSPWHCLECHAPQGSIARARREVYRASADERRNVNGIPLAEPDAPRPVVEAPPAKDTRIVRAAIHPAIGVARVGNSKTDFFLGPEVAHVAPLPPGSYRDRDGALKRQAARFRIYGYNAGGEVVGELTAQNADITWSVELANTKGAWYQFQLALDIPEASAADPSKLRNPLVKDRASLMINPGPRNIRGAGTSGTGSAFDSGQFLGKSVYLGELRTDAQGHLLVLGGHGQAASADGKAAQDFANNDGWHDDVSDGPVRATVSINGRDVRVESSWVVVAPPNYAPARQSVRTMYDLITDTHVRAGALSVPTKPSFTNDILPLFERLSGLQWVNQGFAAEFGWKGPHEFTEALLTRLSTPSTGDSNAELRNVIANKFRDFDRDSWSPTPWPWLYGDAMNVPAAATPRQHTTLTETQLSQLRKWAAGDFEADWTPGAARPMTIEQVPLPEQPAMLDRAALSHCLADAFHPGCEMTWPMRHATMYGAPFRIRIRSTAATEPNYGSQLTPEVALSVDGPLFTQPPGGLTRWMAVPWQTDTASCRSGYSARYGKKYDPYLPTFWPARVPNQVLSESAYNVVLDATRPRGERLAAFAHREDWFRQLGPGGYFAEINKMAEDIGIVGVVEPRPGLQGDPDFPPSMEVEQLRTPLMTSLEDVASGPMSAMAAAICDNSKAFPASSDELDLELINKVHRFPRGLPPR